MPHSIITKKNPEKSLIVSLQKHSGRNNQGRITVRHQGGGSRKMYRLVDFGQEHANVRGTVETIEYDPNRNAFIALVYYQDGSKGYVLAWQGISKGQNILCAPQTDVAAGNRTRLEHIQVGTMVFNIELEEGRGGKIVRSAGAGAQVVAQEGGNTHVQLPSTEIRKIRSACYATVGLVSNPEHKYQRVKNAGRSRLKGRRPTVRGTVMNPVDHPHGGGEGRQPVGLKHPKTPWGKPALGVKTRKRKKWTNKLIVQRRKKKK
ncbi:MAG: 50S ribosomal protein L2 [Candidatus Wildermuthbacteria bacterium]|nr:50S ribosomal protein L2 [Candidatus Wildermuthbacteria bacterium]